MNTKATIVANCPLCDTRSDVVLAEKLRRGEGTVYYCESCKHGYLVPKTAFDPVEYYAEGYRDEVSHHATGEATNPGELLEVYSKYQHDRLQLISPRLTRESHLLEIGASAGQFLIHVKDLVARAHAVELERAACDFLRDALEIDCDANVLAESRFADREYDVVCSFQVLEHVESPVEFLRDVRSVMKPDGVAFIEVPNLNDPLRTVWDIPAYESFYYHSAHFHYFTEDSLRKVALEAGFSSEHVKILFTQDYNLLNHLHWVMNEAPQATCDVGLSEIDLTGRNEAIAGWLTERLRELNKEYLAKLIEMKVSSNLMMVLTRS